ncbi:cytochrome c1 [Acidiphilium sp. PA]|uniref:cytochrome c1 n=1 Tax=Acidiphilium sp. PA TaxID=2871705 RepID=UPI002242EE34|nr:cytochrome c1 [Acidiphilium sp. PA]MCW8306660.1 cytochrome c1 [Acidiphilium sp. PA]
MRAILLALAVLLPAVAFAGAPQFGFQSWFGGFDKAELQIGFATYQANCARCHSLNLVSPNELQTLGLTPAQVTALLAKGKPVTKPEAGGAVAGDLSLYEAGHRHGASAVFDLMTGYRTALPNMTMLPGHYYNIAYPGGQIAMAPSLKPGSVMLADGKAASVPVMAHDVAAFLAWTADPTLDERKATGLRAILFLLVLGVVGFLVMATRMTR